MCLVRSDVGQRLDLGANVETRNHYGRRTFLCPVGSVHDLEWPEPSLVVVAIVAPRLMRGVFPFGNF